MKESILRPDAATGTTTAMKMTKTEINEEKMFAIRERIEKTVRPLAENYCKFNGDVNEITVEEMGLYRRCNTPDEIVRVCVTILCEIIKNLRGSAYDKIYTLEKLEDLVNYCQDGAILGALLGDEEIWDKTVRDTADKRIEEYKKWLNK